MNDGVELYVPVEDDWIASMTVYRGDERVWRVGVWLLGVWVHPDHRGSGLAETLLRSQQDWVRTALGADRLWPHVGGDNPRARRLYERLGFQATGEVERFPGRDVDEHVMVAEL